MDCDNCYEEAEEDNYICKKCAWEERFNEDQEDGWCGPI